MEVERAQQRGGGLAAGGGGAAVGDGGVGSLEGSGVFKGRHRNGRPGPGFCCGKTAIVISELLRSLDDNSLVSGCLNNSLRGLQVIQKAAARIPYRQNNHITPVLASRHWLQKKKS